MEEDYSLEGMIETFKKHNDVHEANNKEMQKKIDCGEWEKQPWMEDKFSVSLALHHICVELKKVRDAQIAQEDSILRNLILSSSSQVDPNDVA